jgi:hypothetical protein
MVAGGARLARINSAFGRPATQEEALHCLKGNELGLRIRRFTVYLETP